jgi:hypothetical protein
LPALLCLATVPWRQSMAKNEAQSDFRHLAAAMDTAKILITVTPLPCQVILEVVKICQSHMAPGIRRGFVFKLDLKRIHRLYITL